MVIIKIGKVDYFDLRNGEHIIGNNVFDTNLGLKSATIVDPSTKLYKQFCAKKTVFNVRYSIDGKMYRICGDTIANPRMKESFKKYGNTIYTGFTDHYDTHEVLNLGKRTSHHETCGFNGTPIFHDDLHGISYYTYDFYSSNYMYSRLYAITYTGDVLSSSYIHNWQSGYNSQIGPYTHSAAGSYGDYTIIYGTRYYGYTYMYYHAPGSTSLTGIWSFDKANGSFYPSNLDIYDKNDMKHLAHFVPYKDSDTAIQFYLVTIKDADNFVNDNTNMEAMTATITDYPSGIPFVSGDSHIKYVPTIFERNGKKYLYLQCLDYATTYVYLFEITTSDYTSAKLGDINQYTLRLCDSFTQSERLYATVNYNETWDTFFLCSDKSVKQFTIDTDTDKFVYQRTVCVNWEAFGLTHDNKIAFTKNGGELHIEHMSLPQQVYVRFEDPEYVFDGTTLDTNIICYAKNYKDEYLALDITVKLTNGAVFTDTGLTTRVVTLSDSGQVTAPVTISQAGNIGIEATVAY